mgnify:CR=1 FL=1
MPSEKIPPREIKSIIEERYLLLVQDIQAVSGGNITEKHHLITDQGQYLLRVRHGFFRPRDLAADHAFLDHLAQNRLPVPGLVETKGGTTFFAHEGKFFALQEYLEHDQTLEDVVYHDLAPDLFDLLGRFHQTSNNYQETIRKPPYLGNTRVPIGHDEKYFLGPQKYGASRFREAAETLAPGQRKAFQNQIRYFMDTLKRIFPEYQQACQVGPLLINHNDFYGNNILFQGGEIVGIVDFDFCHTGLYAVDLIEALHGAMIWHEEESRYLGMTAEGDVRLEKGLESLSQYFTHNPDFPRDGRLLINMLIVKLISLAFYPAFDFWQNIPDKQEGFVRLKKVIHNLEEIHSLEL